MEKISIDIKSLEKFKETIIIHILPFRFRNNNLELLLHKANESNDYFKDFSDFRLKSDVTDIFAAARLLLQLVHNQIFILDQTVFFFYTNLLIFFLREKIGRTPFSKKLWEL
jgi:hypothetical protein